MVNMCLTPWALYQNFIEIVSKDVQKAAEPEVKQTANAN